MTGPTAPQTAVDAAWEADAWRDADLLATVRKGYPLGPEARARIEVWYERAIRAESSAETERLPDESWCDCDREPIYGIRADRHLPSCRYGIVMDYLDIRDPRALAPADAAGGQEARGE